MGLIRRARRPAPDPAATADVVQRLAVLLRAGLPPTRAWTVLDDAGVEVATRAARAARTGGDVAAALAAEGGAWRAVAAAWSVATVVGAPLAEALHAIADALREGQQAADDIRVALAEPAATARLLGWLPLVAVALGIALGFDTARILLTTPAGGACLGVGLLLIVVSRRWSAALVRRARPAAGIPGLRAEIAAIAVAGGASIERAQALLRDALPDAAAGGDTDTAEGIDATLALSRAAGVPAADLLRSTAWLSRHRARTDARVRAARLATRLLLPLGVCTLPAFLLLGVAPTLLSILGSGVLTL